jgi:hypothetical protein
MIPLFFLALKRSSFQKWVCKFTPKMFYEIDSRFQGLTFQATVSGRFIDKPLVDLVIFCRGIHPIYGGGLSNKIYIFMYIKSSKIRAFSDHFSGQLFHCFDRWRLTAPKVCLQVNKN